MDFALTKEQEAFRAEIREFLSSEIPAEARVEDGWISGYSREFSQKLGRQGWIGLTWPKQYGGQEKSYLDRLILTEELLRAGAPVAAHWLGDRQVGPALLAYGSEEQKQEILPQVCQGEIVFCLGMSEPGSGSDLASLQTRAEEEGDHYTLNGQKIWTSFAHVAETMPIWWPAPTRMLRSIGESVNSWWRWTPRVLMCDPSSMPRGNIILMRSFLKMPRCRKTG